MLDRGRERETGRVRKSLPVMNLADFNLDSTQYRGAELDEFPLFFREKLKEVLSYSKQEVGGTIKAELVDRMYWPVMLRLETELVAGQFNRKFPRVITYRWRPTNADQLYCQLELQTNHTPFSKEFHLHLLDILDIDPKNLRATELQVVFVPKR